MPDILTSPLQERIDRVFEARERHLEDVRRREQAAERERYERAARFKELVDGVIRPVLKAGGARLRELGHEFDITAHGLLDDGRFGDDQHIRFNLSLGGHGDHAFVHAGEASLGFAASVFEPTVEATLRVLGRDRAAMSPYRRSHEETRVLEPGEVTPQVVEELLLAFLEAAVESTYVAADEPAPT
jgi:hypothetical protein